MPRPCTVSERERLYLVLQDVGERQEASLAGIDGTDGFNSRLFILESEDSFKPTVGILAVVYPGICCLFVNLVPE